MIQHDNWETLSLIKPSCTGPSSLAIVTDKELSQEDSSPAVPSICCAMADLKALLSLQIRFGNSSVILADAAEGASTAVDPGLMHP